MLSAREIAAVIAELGPRVVGGQVQKIREPLPGTVVLTVRSPGRTTRLVLSCRPGGVRIAAAAEAGPTAPEPSTLGRWLRSALKGRRLVSLSQVPGDRVVWLRFEAGALVAELTGGSANLLGLAPDGRILAVARPPSGGSRDLRPGRPYVPPPPPPPRTDPPPRFADAEAVELAAQALEGHQAEDARGRQHAQVVRRARQRLERLARNLEGDLARAEGAEAWARQGELLKPHVARLRRGMTAVEVPDWFAEGAPPVIVPLDPTLDGAANVARLFHKARRARIGGERALERLVEVEAQLAQIDAEAAAEVDPVALEARLRAEGLSRPKAGGGGRAQVAPRLPYRLWVNLRGDQIRVGRGGADNHALTFHVARGNDHWLHVRDVPGAHVVVSGATPHPETLLDAAALAVWHSALRAEALADVSVTQRKHVRPVPGAPGRVTLAAARTLTVADAAGRVAGLRRVDEAP